MEVHFYSSIKVFSHLQFSVNIFISESMFTTCKKKQNKGGREKGKKDETGERKEGGSK